MIDHILHNEQDLLLKIAEGDEIAFAAIFDKYYDALRPFIWRYTRSFTDAEEVIQETFIRVWLNRDKLPEIQHFQAWIYKVASREYLLFLRRKLKAQRVTDQLKLAESDEQLVFTPQEEFQMREIREVIREAVQLLPEQRKRIYQMSREEGMKIADIAAALSISDSTVKNTLTNALKQIREHLASRGHIIPVVCLLTVIN